MQREADALVVNLIEDKVVAERQFLQETNFQDESDAFKADALDNFEKHYGKKKDRPKSKYEQWVEPDGDPSF